MSESFIILGDVKNIAFGELQIERSIKGESHFRMLVIENGDGGKLIVKLCSDDPWDLIAIEDKELERFRANGRDIELDAITEVAF